MLSTRADTEVPLLLNLGLIFALIGCVVLHELGHALMARRFGIDTDRILLTPIGGVAQFAQAIRTPGQELAIALAGPAVNVVIAMLLGLLVLAGSTLLPTWLHTTPGTFVFLLLVLNVVMAVFNLLPAFPMDGGRVLRAVLSSVVGQLRATRAAVIVGTFVAVFGGLAGAVYVQTPWPLAIAAFVIWTGNRELLSVEAEQRRRAEEAHPVVMPLRSTIHWPSLATTVFVWDAQARRWVRGD